MDISSNHSLFESLPAKRRSEIELLLCCVRTHLDRETIDRIRFLIQKGIDWEYFVQIALQHRVMPVLYRNLKKTCPESVPVGTMNQLRRYFLVNAARNHVLVHELHKTLGIFEQNRIIAVPFKGPALAEYLYGDLVLRQFDDLDILIHRQDAIKAHKLLLTRSYRPEVRLNDDQYDAYMKTEYSMAYSHSETRVTIELHWDMLGRHSSRPHGLVDFRKIETTTLDGKKVLGLSPDDLLVYLCRHSAKDCWKTLEAVCSVAQLLRSHPALDWTRLLKRAEDMHCERMLLLGLFMAHDLLGVDLPSHVDRGIEVDQKIGRIAGEIYGRFFSNDGALSRNYFDPNFSPFQVKVRDIRADKIHYCLSLAFRPTRVDWRVFHLRSSLSFLHYAFRPIRLARGLGENLLRKCCKSQ